MGRRYRLELESLAATYEWALSTPIDLPRPRAVDYQQFPLLAIGSGGSLSAATFAAYLHEFVTGRPARAATPLDVALTRLYARGLNVLILTAGGGNPDILAAFDRIQGADPRHLEIVCMRSGSRLAKRANGHAADVLEFDLPSGKDGFLATNSLLASFVILARLFGQGSSLPSSLAGVFHPGRDDAEYREELSTIAAPLWARETIVALYSPTTSAAAQDLESKFVESALGHVQLADYRNFAHGRHHWLAKRSGSTGIVAFVSEEVSSLAERTLKLIPDDVPVLPVRIGSGVPGAISALVHVLHLVGLAGEAQRVDPGRPQVPEFGKKIYHLRMNTLRQRKHLVPSARAAAAIERKARAPIERLADDSNLEAWNTAYTAFVRRLQETRFSLSR